MQGVETAGRSMAGSIAAFFFVSAGCVAVASGVLALVFAGPGARRAVAVSAVLALAVQMVAYVVAFRAIRMPGRPIMTAWVVGMILRFGALAALGLVGVRAWQLPPVPALVSLVIFLFVSTLVEPWLLQS
jgi:hypothetical protein